ncbi:Alg5-prov protein [Phellopilus nigrolimitatus]|nr:Alg5-prov protein [Phellopilus nigrolimitatus]
MADVTYLSLMLGVGLTFLASLCCIYAALVLLSPPPIDALPSEKKYRSATSPKTPQDLPDIRTTPTANVDLSIVIPAFNEVPRLPSMLDSTIKHLSKPAYKSRSREIVIVDDGSSDQTTDTALNLAEKYKSWDIRVITLETNIGKGGAVRHGMLYSRGRRLLMVDADGASRFEDLEVLWKEMDRIAPNDEPAVVVGSRAHLVKTEVVVKRSVLRNMAMYALHLTLRLVGVGHINDTQCGFKLFTREAARAIFPIQHLKGWIFDVEIILLAKQLQIPVAEVPINWSEIPESKLRLMRDSLFMFRDLLILRANQLTGRWTVPKKLKAQ